MKPKQILRIIFLSLGLVCSCSKIEQNRPPNIVWIVSEDNSKHYLSLFDNNGIETPNIRGLAEHGILFNKAFSNAPVCSVARSTIISGCYALELELNTIEGLYMFLCLTHLKCFQLI